METPTSCDLFLLTDENISPNIAPKLRESGIDGLPLRDRGLLRVADHTVLRLADEEHRAVATINEFDFEKLVSRKKTHNGVIVIPSGGSRDEQHNYILAAARYLRAMGNAMAMARDRIICVDEDYGVTSRIVRLQDEPIISAQARPSRA